MFDRVLNMIIICNLILIVLFGKVKDTNKIDSVEM